MDHEIYKEQILDLFRNPLNKGILENFTHEAIRRNPICGDEIKIQLKVEKEIIKDVKFSGIGCAISQASASLITEKIKRMNVEETLKLNKEEIFELLGIPISYMRLNCAILPLEVIQEALRKKC